MKTNRKIVSFVFAFSTILLSVASCGEQAVQNPSEIEKKTVQSETAEVNTEAAVPNRAACNVPVDTLDFAGRNFNMHASNWQGYQYYFFAEEETGDVMNDALYHRRQKIEDDLNIHFVTVKHTDSAVIVNDVMSLIQAGDTSVDQMFLHCISGVSTLSSGGFLYNLDLLPYIDTDAEWWNHRAMDSLRLGKNTYYAVNDFMIPTPYVIFFNKQMISDFDYENPYQLVYDGKWTLDAMETMARGVVADLDGNGVMDINDRYGITTNETSKYISFMIGSDQYMTSRDSDGRMQPDMNSEKTLSLVERFCDMSKSDVFYKKDYSELTIDTGRVLFYLDASSSAEWMRDYTVDFGFLPYPKYDENQENYLSLDWGGLMCIPTSISDSECVGAVMELQAYYSAEEVIPTYYDTILQGRLARDEDTVAMLDILFDTITYEPGGNYFGFSSGFGEMFYLLPNLAIQGQSTNFTSLYEKRVKTMNNVLSKFYESLDAVESAD